VSFAELACISSEAMRQAFFKRTPPGGATTLIIFSESFRSRTNSSCLKSRFSRSLLRP